MRRNRQNSPGPVPSAAGDMWHALAALRQTHSEPVGRLAPFERPDALLSLCSHCHGTGRAHPLWAPTAGQA
ncbi:hypothetical protein ACIPW5_25790 [Streptomyces sp. NPDC090077]|uniref:hypothetical protein n=1 Tax=Streptomyces sp. NPDC090077 TaxID=3365938 RepID=UPI0037FE3D90